MAEPVEDALTDAERNALDILSDGGPHDTWGRATNPTMQRWGRLDVGVLNANVAGRLVRGGLARYARCPCCSAGLGVEITGAGNSAIFGDDAR